MKLRVDPKEFADAITWAARALPNRPTTPALAGLLLKAGPDGLTLSAFDYDISRQAHAAADIAEPGQALLSGRILAEIAKSLPNQPVDIALSGTEATITCGRAQFTLPTMRIDDYPQLPTAPDAIGEIDAHTFTNAITQVATAADPGNALPMLTGIRLEIDGNQLTLAATDRYRIAARNLTWAPTEDDVMAEVVIPARALADTVKAMPAGPITIGLGNGLAAFWGGGRTTTIRLLDDDYIDYQSRLNAAAWSTWADFEVAELVDAVKRMALVGERYTAVQLAFSDGQVLIQGGNGDLGRGAETVDAELSGDAIQIAFQTNFLLDALAGVEGERARIGMNSPARPALILPADDGDDPAYRHLVMALRAP